MALVLVLALSKHTRSLFALGAGCILNHPHYHWIDYEYKSYPYQSVYISEKLIYIKIYVKYYYTYTPWNGVMKCSCCCPRRCLTGMLRYGTACCCSQCRSFCRYTRAMKSRLTLFVSILVYKIQHRHTAEYRLQYKKFCVPKHQNEKESLTHMEKDSCCC